MKTPTIEDIQAGEAFRETLVPQANDHHGTAPLWYGWAIMDAFLAGVGYAREQERRSFKEGRKAD